MKEKLLGFLSLSILVLSSCAEGGSNISSSSGNLNEPAPYRIRDYTLKVNQTATIIPIGKDQPLDLTYEFEGDAISIFNHVIYIHQSNTITNVKACDALGHVDEFVVTSPLDEYASTRNEEISEEWLSPLNSIKADIEHDDFPKGIDMSTVQAIYDAGAVYYNAAGQAEDVFRIIRDAGVNYVRLRLWNDPNNYTSQGKVSYGGGNNDLSTDLKMAHLAKNAGLKLYLDIHYSDFWADPSKQIFPKAWTSFTTADEVKSAIYDYTRSVLNAFDEVGALPDMVSLGNETTPGMLLQFPGPTNEELTGGEPGYTTGAYYAPTALRGTNKSKNFHDYIASANAAVKDVDATILTMIHLAKGLSDSNYIIDYFNQFNDIDYDVIGLSAYPYYQGRPSVIKSGLISVADAFPSKKITLAETSYGYTFAKDALVSNIFDNGEVISGYPVSTSGQALMIRDLLEAVDSIENGYGLFYWEGAFIPVKGVGWADSRSKNSWANQALFTYDGHVLPSINVFND
ncbi:MAG TPA: glycosyl hydrolase 53 family protein [Bacilli bacterium]|nr:glycosyl hydrolase 53 family protein [Bacilli bacterium]